MPFVRKKRGRVLLVHSRREGGKVCQQELAAFDSAAAIEEVLDPRVWESWQRAQERSNPGLRWDWERIRAELAGGMETLAERRPPEAASSGLGKLASALTVELARLSPARAADQVVLEPAGPVLKLLSEEIHRVLGLPEADPRSSEMHRSDPVEDQFDQAMEHWWRGDRKRAVQGYRKVLKADPKHADAHNHLGIVAMEGGKLDEAEAHFRTAIESGSRQIEVDHGLLEWSHLENRSYLRAHGNLALVLRLQGRWAQAAAVHEQMLRWNPNDNQGVRYLLGEEHHRLGDLERARAAYEKAAGDPITSFGLGLLLLELGEQDGAERVLLRGMAENRYVAPMLLLEPWSRLDGWHGSNVAEPEDAGWIVKSTRDLWAGVPEALERLAELCHRPAVVEWRSRLDDTMVALRDAPGGSDRRRAILDAQRRLTSDRAIERVRTAAGSGASPDPLIPTEEEERFEVGASFVVDMRHRVVPKGEGANLPAGFWRIVAYEGRIVEAGSAWGRPAALDSAIRCRRKPRRKPCPGHLRIRVVGDHIAWACTRCRDNGQIHHWQSLDWDLSGSPAPDDARCVFVPWTRYEKLRQIDDHPLRVLLARSVYGSDGPTLVGSATELLHAADLAAWPGDVEAREVLTAAMEEVEGDS